MRFSVILASRGRPAELLRTLQAIRQLDHSDFEVVVVADPTSLAALSEDWFRTVPFDEPNLSKARNAGIEAAAGDTCAFIDDDAVPEPLWLQHHEAALAATGAVASVGFVRGRNGIGFQSRVASMNREPETHQENDRGDAPFVPVLAKGRALKLIGTNMVVRRQTLAQLGGFDPAYRYFLGMRRAEGLFNQPRVGQDVLMTEHDAFRHPLTAAGKENCRRRAGIAWRTAGARGQFRR